MLGNLSSLPYLHNQMCTLSLTWDVQWSLWKPLKWTSSYDLYWCVYRSHSSGLPAMTCTEVSIEATQVDFSPWLVLMYPWKHCPDVILLSISYRHNKCLVQQGLFYPQPLLETDIAAPGKIVVWLVAAPNPSCGLNANFVTQMSPFPGHCFTGRILHLHRHCVAEVSLSLNPETRRVSKISTWISDLRWSQWHCVQNMVRHWLAGAKPGNIMSPAQLSRVSLSTGVFISTGVSLTTGVPVNRGSSYQQGFPYQQTAVIA